MKKTVYILAFLLASFKLFSQVSYSGFIDKYPIELVTDIYLDKEVRAIYTYSDFDEPIILDGEIQNGKLTLFEKDKAKKKFASLVFENFDAENNAMAGIWTNLKTKKQLKISLSKHLNNGDSIKEIIQPVTLGNKYFKLIISGDGDAVTGVKILEKKTDKLLQKIDLDCQLRGLNNITVGDYNFDGIKDFSVFESSYAGPNTSSLYFLFDAKTNKFFESGFSGVSLEFNNKTKRITERNQCCAGASVTTAEYKVVKNKMVLIKEQCYKWDEKKGKLVERKMKECE
jgi:hypothetical protein